MRCLITGINGFAASHLADKLLQSGHDVWGTTRLRAKQDNISHIKNVITVLPADLNDARGIDCVIRDSKPDIVFHLAAQSFVGWSWTNPEETLRTNIFGTLNVLEAVKKHAPDARVHIASSSQVYGSIPKDEQPMGLKTRFNPMNPYDTSKLAQEMLALQYFNSYGLKVIRTRAFNITGPRRGDSFAESSWAKQIAENEKKIFCSRPEVTCLPAILKHGNLESFRDYVDVRDVVRAYEKIAIEGTPGKVYILGSGKATSMGAILKMLLDRSLVDLITETDPSRMRPSDTPFMEAGDSVLECTIPLSQSLEDILNYWREKV